MDFGILHIFAKHVPPEFVPSKARQAAQIFHRDVLSPRTQIGN